MQGPRVAGVAGADLRDAAPCHPALVLRPTPSSPCHHRPAVRLRRRPRLRPGFSRQLRLQCARLAGRPGQLRAAVRDHRRCRHHWLRDLRRPRPHQVCDLRHHGRLCQRHGEWRSLCLRCSERIRPSGRRSARAGLRLLPARVWPGRREWLCRLHHSRLQLLRPRPHQLPRLVSAAGVWAGRGPGWRVWEAVLGSAQLNTLASTARSAPRHADHTMHSPKLISRHCPMHPRHPAQRRDQELPS